MNNKEYSMKVNEQELKFSIVEWRCIYNTLKEDIPEIEENFYDAIVSNLKNEANELNKKLNFINARAEDFNKYISILKSLRETLELISKYDWKLNYSEYKVKDDNDNMINQVSIWESNHDNQIRNHKYWNVIGDNTIKINNDGIDINTFTNKIIENMNEQFKRTGIINR